MTTHEGSGAYGMRIRNNAGTMLDKLSKAERLPVEMQAAAVIAQSNLAIAASLAELADVLRTKS